MSPQTYNTVAWTSHKRNTEYLTEGFAQIKPKYERIWPSLHAEVDALLKLSTRHCNLVITVKRTNKNGELCMARPCQHCLRFMKKFHVKGVLYSTSDGEMVYEKMADINIDKACISAGWRNWNKRQDF